MEDEKEKEKCQNIIKIYEKISKIKFTSRLRDCIVVEVVRKIFNLIKQ